jgi:hypothetical protein
MLPSSCGIGGGSCSSSVFVDGERGLFFPNFRNDLAFPFNFDCGLPPSSGGDETPDAIEEARDMVDGFGLMDDAWEGYMAFWRGESGEWGGKDIASGESDAMDLFML